jgi:O-methyltransferase
MGREHVELHREQETLLMTLYLHARDAASDAPILGDTHARDVLDRVDYDFARLDRLRGNQPLIVSRAKAIDERVRTFLAEHPDAVVLHLGCGLDSRVLRIDPGPGVTWIDLDQQPVIELRRRFYPDRDGVALIGASVTDSDWWSQVPTGRPTLVVGEGLLMYLSLDGLRTLMDNVLRQPAPTRTLIFDTLARWVGRAARWQPNFREAGTGFESSTDDLDAAIRDRPEIALVEELSMSRAARSVTSGVLGAIIAVLDAVPAGHRSMVLRTYRG